MIWRGFLSPVDIKSALCSRLMGSRFEKKMLEVWGIMQAAFNDLGYPRFELLMGTNTSYKPVQLTTIGVGEVWTVALSPEYILGVPSFRSCVGAALEKSFLEIHVGLFHEYIHINTLSAVNEKVNVLVLRPSQNILSDQDGSLIYGWVKAHFVPFEQAKRQCASEWARICEDKTR